MRPRRNCSDKHDDEQDNKDSRHSDFHPQILEPDSFSTTSCSFSSLVQRSLAPGEVINGPVAHREPVRVLEQAPKAIHAIMASATDFPISETSLPGIHRNPILHRSVP